MTSHATSINPEDRLFHLILALMSTSQGLNKDQILTTVRGYREDTEAGMTKESIERRFERDKDALRELGIPLEALIPPEDDGNNKNTLYRIPKGDYELPPDISFTSLDIALLNLAAAVWREGSLSKEAHIAQLKLASFGLRVDENLLGFAPVISTRDPALQALRDAIENENTVSFEYAKPGETTPTLRSVSPWALINHEGRWHLYALEDGTDRPKTFLLRRIISSIRSTPVAAAPSPDQAAARALKELQDLFQRTTATLSVRPGSDGFWALSARAGTRQEGSQMVVHYTDVAIFSEELTALAADVVVISPEDLKARVAKNLQTLVAAHG
jgi:proteasome accessory factor B